MVNLMRFLKASLIIMLALTSGVPVQAVSSALAASSTAQPAGYPVTITPDAMQFTGHVTTPGNCANPTVCAWLETAPPHSIMLGVNPSSPSPNDWAGGTATAEVLLDAVYPKTRLALRVAWPTTDGKGIHSPMRNRMVSIDFDGERVWDKRTVHRSTFMDYYGAESTAIQTTLVITETGTHTLRFAVEPNTAWDMSEITVLAYPYPENYLGIGYSPYRDCQYPGGEENPLTEDMREDMVRLSHTTNAIRTYSSLNANQYVPGLANERGLDVFPGAWLDYPKTTLEADDAEIEGLVSLACGANVRGVIVGNEYYLRHRTPEHLTYLHNRIHEVKAKISAQCGHAVPVTTAEIDDLMFDFADDGVSIRGIRPEYKTILDELDFAMIHIYPFWSTKPIEGAAVYAVNRSVAARSWLEQAYPGQNKWLIIGETGWPSAGGANGKAVPGAYNQRKYLLEMLPLIEEHGLHLLYFDAFDELWKIEEGGGVGQRWGYGYTDRSAKHDFNGIFLPPELLPPLAWPFSSSVPKVFLPSITAQGNNIANRFNVFSEWPEGPGHFVPSGWMGDLNHIGYYGCDRSDPHSGEMAIRASFASGGPRGWAGIYWLYPENNWGDLPQGIDLRTANKITFWAKGDAGGEKIRFFAGGVGTSGKPYPDSLRPQVSTGFITLTKEWKQYAISLAGKDLSHVVGGFGWMTEEAMNPTGATFYLDDINYVYDPALSAAPPLGDAAP